MEKGKSAIICIGSPLQVMCAIEAIKQFNLESWDIYVLDDGISFKKTETLLDRYDLKFSRIPLSYTGIKKIGYLCSSICKARKQVDYLMLGDYRLVVNKARFVPHLKSGGQLVYLDDGAYTIGLSHGKTSLGRSARICDKVICTICSLRHISYNNYFTIFYDEIDRPDWNVIPNRLTAFCNENRDENGSIVIIGTNVETYCNAIGITEKKFEDLFLKYVLQLRRQKPDARIVYVPHRRDTDVAIPRICNENGVQIMMPESCVEIDLPNRGLSPAMICGYNSTALYTLKHIYPSAEFRNLMFTSGQNDQGMAIHRDLAALYASRGIKTVYVDEL